MVNKRLIWLAMVFVLVGCGGVTEETPAITASPVSTATSLPSDTPTAMVTETPTPRPTATATDIPSPPVTPTGEAQSLFGLFFYDLALLYDGDSWEEKEFELEHRSIDDCVLEEQGPTEPPAVDLTVTLNGIVYDVGEFIVKDEETLERWYMARTGFESPNPADTPVLIVRAEEQDPGPCVDAAERVLATLHNPTGSP